MEEQLFTQSFQHTEDHHMDLINVIAFLIAVVLALIICSFYSANKKFDDPLKECESWKDKLKNVNDNLIKHINKEINFVNKNTSSSINNIEIKFHTPEKLEDIQCKLNEIVNLYELKTPKWNSYSEETDDLLKRYHKKYNEFYSNYNILKKRINNPGLIGSIVLKFKMKKIKDINNFHSCFEQK